MGEATLLPRLGVQFAEFPGLAFAFCGGVLPQGACFGGTVLLPFSPALFMGTRSGPSRTLRLLTAPRSSPRCASQGRQPLGPVARLRAGALSRYGSNAGEGWPHSLSRLDKPPRLAPALGRPCPLALALHIIGDCEVIQLLTPRSAPRPAPPTLSRRLLCRPGALLLSNLFLILWAAWVELLLSSSGAPHSAGELLHTP